jgi:outer membrane protein OmpA-like peptidoglycan-associated protein
MSLAGKLLKYNFFNEDITMKTFLKASIAAAAMMSIATAAFAGHGSPHKTVKDERGNVVVNTFNNCVITKWSADRNECMDASREARTVYFDFNRSSLTPAAKAKLDSLVDIIRNSAAVDSVSIVGYADRIGSTDYNYRLSQRRSRSVEKYLASRGYYDTKSTEVRSFGESRPVSDCEGVTGKELRACLWRDRRVEIELNYSY